MSTDGAVHRVRGRVGRTPGPLENARVRRLVARLARENAELRDSRIADGTLDGPDGLRLRPATHEVSVRDTPVALTPKEFETLQALLERRGEVVPPEVLAAAAESEALSGRQVVEARVSRLRRKLRRAGAGNAIRTVRKVGYTIR